MSNKLHLGLGEFAPPDIHYPSLAAYARGVGVSMGIRFWILSDWKHTSLQKTKTELRGEEVATKIYSIAKQ